MAEKKDGDSDESLLERIFPGRVMSWGSNTFGLLGLGEGIYGHQSAPTLIECDAVDEEFNTSNIICVSAGYNHSAAVTDDGRLYVWGCNNQGQLGLDAFSRANRGKPTLLNLKENVSFKSVSCGENYTLALAVDGSIYSWGLNGSGQLGTRNYNSSFVPVLAVIKKGIVFKQVVAGRFHCLALTDKGRVYGWGNGSYGKLGVSGNKPTTNPVKISFTDNIMFLFAGENHSGALTTKGIIYTWGDNNSGQLGNGKHGRGKSRPKAIKCYEGFVHAAAGNNHNAAVTHDGRLFTWGEGSQGNLGHGDNTTYPSPKEVVLKDVKFVKVACGNQYTIALTDTGIFYSMGHNSYAQLGIGSYTITNVPTKVANALNTPPLIDISAGFQHCLSITGVHYVPTR